MLAIVGVSALTGPVAAADPGEDLDTIGIKLMEAPADRRDDSRAQRYIIDHLAPGTTIRRQVEISNRTDKRKRIQLYAAAADVQGEQFRFGEGRTANELSSWTSLSQPEVTLEPGQNQAVTTTIAVPPTASAGERYAVVWASAASDPKPNAVAKVHRVGIRVYLDVGPGGEPASGFDIEEFTTSRAADGRPSLTVKVTNTGGRALDLSGTLWLTDEPGEIRAGPFPVVEGTTLAPEQTGKVTVALPSRLDNGPWKAELTLTSGVVRRTATMVVTFPDPGDPPATFKASNVRMIFTGSAAAGLLVLVGIILFLRRAQLKSLAAAVTGARRRR
ncbi:hypothetical protein GCM10027280_19720 [Micromonospora polyrhachis]|uniref:Peptidase n=1 Tax=Micromonospora polyrhachis TaxID=1282883 RepID=A0A7W7SLX8_9ACTN|nr:DUF916 domain-containing protein [Micromonospora polyrhachis]MBB4957066.1 hypothetical protein [Micromonospora polyrhachis]